MAKVICLFNHKGGVSKTTTTFNLGWMLAERGKKVIIADFDPQCNLTGMVLGIDERTDGELIEYSDNPPNNIKSGLAPAFEAKPTQIVGIDCKEVIGKENLWLLPGNIGLSEYETTLGISQDLGGSVVTLKNLPGSLRYLLDKTADKYNADYILIDLNPSLSPVNQNILMTSDHFIVPLHPDFFSTMALHSLSKSLPRWVSWASKAYEMELLRCADYPFPKPKASFIGCVIQNYRPRNGSPSKAFKVWFDELTNALKTNFIPQLVKSGLLDEREFREKAGFEACEPILQVSDFNSLIAKSQEYKTPVYALTQEMTGLAGAAWETTKKNMDDFSSAFKICADKVIALSE